MEDLEEMEAPQICSHKLITTQTSALFLIWEHPGSSTVLELLDHTWTVLILAPLKGLSDEKHQYALDLFCCSPIQHKCSIEKWKIQAFLSFSVDLFF